MNGSVPSDFSQGVSKCYQANYVSLIAFFGVKRYSGKVASGQLSHLTFLVNITSLIFLMVT